MRFGDLDLQTAEIIITDVQYRQMADRILNTSPISRRTGNKFLSDDFTTKTITMNGYVISNSASGLIGVIDTMHKFLSLPQKELSIDADRVYIATCSKAEFPELNFTRSVSPFTLEFLSVNPFSYGTNLNAGFVLPSGILESTINITISGTAYNEPNLRLTTASGAGNAGITKMIISHLTSGQEVVISGAWSRNVETVLNYDNATVTLSGLLYDYTGSFDNFPVGNNSIKITFEGSNNFGVDGEISYSPRFWF